MCFAGSLIKLISYPLSPPSNLVVQTQLQADGQAQVSLTLMLEQPNYLFHE